MGLKLLLGLLLTALFAAPIGYAAFESKFSHEHLGYQSGGPKGASVHGVPGPIAGAGLPIVVAGLGAYWLIRRRRYAQ